MTDFDQAVKLMAEDRIEELRDLLAKNPGLAKERDADNATLLVKWIDADCERGADSLRVLLEAGADTEARRNDQEGTALGAAVRDGGNDEIKVLLDHGADIHGPHAWLHLTALELAESLCEDMDRADDKERVELAAMFREAAGHKIPRRPLVGAPTPLVFVKDAAGLKFWTEKLGFYINFEDNDEKDPNGIYVSLLRGTTEVHLTICNCEDHRHVGNAYLRIPADPIDQMHEELKAAGVKINWGPMDEPWARQFEAEDPDGNRIIFYCGLGEDEEDDAEEGE